MTTKKPFIPNAYAQSLIRADTFAVFNGSIHQWTGTHWEYQDIKDMQAHAHGHLEDTYLLDAPQHIHANNCGKCVDTAVIALARAGKALPITPTCEILAPTKSGYVVKDGTAIKLIPAEKSYGVRYCLTCTYDPDAKAPLFQQFLERSLPDLAVRERVQEYVGYTLIPDARFQVSQLWVGDGSNGKGVLAKIVMALHGKVAALNLTNLSGFALASLVDATLIYVDEMPKAGIDEQVLKSLISGDTVLVQRKYRDDLAITIQGKMVACANHIPITSDHSLGYWRRFEIVPFGPPIKDSEKIYLLAEKITQSELQGVLNWALEGLVRLLNRGSFGKPPTVMKSLHTNAQIATNTVLGWKTDCDIGMTATAETPKTKVFQHYLDWCSQNRVKPMGGPQFWIQASKLLPDIQEIRKMSCGKSTRICNVSLSVPTLKADSDGFFDEGDS